MAQRTRVVFTDDIEAARTIRFGPAGASYEVALSIKNADKLATILKPYLDAARKTGSQAGRSPKSSRPAGPSPREVCAWARAQGIDVKDQGRVPAELITRFHAAQ